MKITRMFIRALIAFLLSLPCAYAQDKPPAQAPATEAPTAQQAVLQIPLKVQMVITEYDGVKKISSMPYTISLNVSRIRSRDSLGQVRAGIRLPVVTGKSDTSGLQYTYLDVGTNIDCWVEKWSDDRYFVNGTVDLSSVYTMNADNQTAAWKPGDSLSGINPIIRHTNGSFAIPLHDGQTGEATTATDPITGHVFKIEVTLTVVK
jgi:hypothetical protein